LLVAHFSGNRDKGLKTELRRSLAELANRVSGMG
jgi:hypothetical protein